MEKILIASRSYASRAKYLCQAVYPDLLCRTLTLRSLARQCSFGPIRRFEHQRTRGRTVNRLIHGLLLLLPFVECSRRQKRKQVLLCSSACKAFRHGHPTHLPCRCPTPSHPSRLFQSPVSLIAVANAKVAKLQATYISTTVIEVIAIV